MDKAVVVLGQDVHFGMFERLKWVHGGNDIADGFEGNTRIKYTIIEHERSSEAYQKSDSGYSN